MMKTLLLLLLALVYTGSAYRCYFCDNSGDNFGQPFDPECGNEYYNGYDDDYSGEVCSTTVYYDSNRTVQRQWEVYTFEDGECVDYWDYLTCYCKGDYCNNRLCQHCGIATTDWWERTSDWWETSPWWERTTDWWDCGADYEGTQGVISSPLYPHNYPQSANCEWTINSPANTKITVNFESFYTETGFDYLEIRDGLNDSDPVLVYLSGHYTNFPLVTSTGNTLYLYFHSDSSSERPGFKLNWSADWWETTSDWWETSPGWDCGADYDGTQGVISSPLYPHDYPQSANCEWTITSPANTKITVNFESFDTEEGDFDYLEIRDGLNDYDPVLLHLSGHYTNFPLVTSTGNTLYLYFHSDSSITRSGFKLNWSADSDETGLQCYSCIDCETVNSNTNVEVSEEFLSCFIAIELGHDHFVIRGGSPDYFEDGVCRHEADGAIVCYCTTDRCNADDAMKLLEYNQD